MRRRELLKAVPLLMAPAAGTRRDTAIAVHTERQSFSYRSHLDHRVGGAGAWISGVRYAVRD